MAKKQKIEPNSEAVNKETTARIEWQYFDENSKPIHLSKVIHKKKPLIIVYPYSYSQTRGLTSRKVAEIELRGWDKVPDVPTMIRSGHRIGITRGGVAHLMRFVYRKYPDVEKVIFTKNGNSRFTKRTITFNWAKFESAVRAVNKETNIYEVRRKSTIANSLSTITKQVDGRTTRLPAGRIAHFISLYDQNPGLNEADVDSILNVLAFAPANQVSVTANFIETKDKINVAYLDDVIAKFDKLLKVKTDNEKDWQKFFEKHGWILANLFPFQVILHDREAYVGGKTVENKEGRVVDFLFQNGFRDNYALLEIKTHNKQLLKNTAYRKPDVYAMHEDLTGAIGQCLDQKNTFLTDMGQKYKILDPKVILIIGMKSKLNENKANCFELIRSNQKNVELVTFDELMDKIKGLRSVLRA